MRMTIAFLRAWLLDDAQSRAWFDDGGRVTIGGETVVVERK
jgi:hypothetical protein